MLCQLPHTSSQAARVLLGPVPALLAVNVVAKRSSQSGSTSSGMF